MIGYKGKKELIELLAKQIKEMEEKGEDPDRVIIGAGTEEYSPRRMLEEAERGTPFAIEMAEHHLELRKRRKEDLITYAERAELADPQDRALFQRLVAEGMELMPALTASVVSEKFGAGIPTVRRWRNGTSAPGVAMRPIVLRYLAIQARELVSKE